MVSFMYMYMYVHVLYVCSRALLILTSKLQAPQSTLYTYTYTLGIVWHLMEEE